MQLLTDDVKAIIPALYSTDDGDTDTLGARMVTVKFFTPWSNWTWYVLEGAEEDGDYLFYGYVEGLENEFGYFTLRELEQVKGPFGLTIERDLYWTPKPISEIATEMYR